MDFGVVLQTDPPGRAVVDVLVRAEAAGFRYGWTFDSCVLWQEPFVIYSQVLARTSTMMVGPMVTNPSTRDWSVTASLFATLNEMFGNRTVCGIGRGDSARRVIGQRPASLAVLREAMIAIKNLAEGREAILNGTPVRIPWIRDGRLEIWMAAYGPKALQLAGEVADGFILQTADPDIARWTLGTVRAGPGGRPGPVADHPVRHGARLRRGRPRPPARPAPLVRRHGRQPRRRPGGTLRRGWSRPSRPDRLHPRP